VLSVDLGRLEGGDSGDCFVGWTHEHEHNCDNYSSLICFFN
jgi:hypothetical protein